MRTRKCKDVMYESHCVRTILSVSKIKGLSMTLGPLDNLKNWKDPFLFNPAGKLPTNQANTSYSQPRTSPSRSAHPVHY